MDDLPKKLRELATMYDDQEHLEPIELEAANEIERLNLLLAAARDEIAELIEEVENLKGELQEAGYEIMEIMDR